jgi:DNA-binding CsgD family transcriptional regulator
VKSTALRNRELRQVSELVGQAKDLGADARAWRTHVVRGLIRLTGGQLGLTLDITGALPAQVPSLVDPIDIGWATPGDRETYFRYYGREVVDDPGATALFGAHQRVRLLTATREQLICDDDWYRSAAVSEIRRSGRVDDFVSASIALRPGVLHGFIVYRPWGERPFAERERRMMRLAQLWLLRLVHPRSTEPAEVAALPPRVRQLFYLLLDGRSIKEAANGMRVAASTVAGYSKTLHRRLGVSSRGELMRRYLPGQRPARPVLPAGLLVPSPAAGERASNGPLSPSRDPDCPGQRAR